MIDYNGKKLKVKVTDTCPGCTPDKIDLSDEAFSQLDSKDKGIISIKWDFVPC
jgi:rare lipoprotein A (peptidoglycan hydrolase)